ncbi:MAG TPA: thioredoxin family protein [Candidatus Thermoplasmatota archaeon]|nr:thioredoxin family protein [Candidatus Thermoplasmatota archaeon]
MSRPTETPREGLEPLRDAEVADWLDARPRGALFFWDAEDAVSQRQRARLEVVAAAAQMPVGVLDVRTDALVASAVGVKSVPALVVFRGGEVAERILGAAPESILKEALR